jgi:hypothetical protein
MGGISTGAPLGNGTMHAGRETYDRINLSGGIRRTMTVPGKYKLKLRNEAGRTGWIVVDRASYHHYRIGSTYGGSYRAR